jgi:RNA polymerase sigma-70 factor, ECF subfamily
LNDETAANGIDGALVSRVATGDVEALALLYDAYASALLGVALRILRERSRAEDAIHDVFVGLQQHAARYDAARGPVSTWLMTMTRNLCIDRLRKYARQNRLAERFAGESSEVALTPDPSSGVDATVVRTALSTLPEEQRTVIFAAYFEGLTYTEIAEHCGIPLGTVKSRAARGLESLRSKLSGDEPGRQTYPQGAHRGVS